MTKANQEQWFRLPGSNEVVSKAELKEKGLNPDDYKSAKILKLSGKVPFAEIRKIIDTLKSPENQN